jgi:hypothetical protein
MFTVEDVSSITIRGSVSLAELIRERIRGGARQELEVMRRYRSKNILKNIYFYTHI